jgi:hypothetical protein
VVLAGVVPLLDDMVLIQLYGMSISINLCISCLSEYIF